MNYNKTIILGHIAQAPELRKTPSGQSVTSFGIATNRAWTDKSGTKQESAEFHNVVAWGKLAELASAYLAKGSLALIEGRLETRSWDDKDGIPHRMTEIIAENIQFGQRHGVTKAEPVVSQPDSDIPIIRLDDDDEDTGELDDDEDTGENMEPLPF